MSTSSIAAAIAPFFTLKGVVIRETRRGISMNATLYLGTKRVVNFIDDGFGGAANIDYVKKEHRGLVQAKIDELGLKATLHLNEFEHVKQIDGIFYDCVIDHIVNHLSIEVLEKKDAKKLEKRLLKEVIYRIDDTVYSRNFKILISDFVKKPKGLAALQQVYDDVSSKIAGKDDAQLYNDRKTLSELGVVLN